MSKPRYNWWPFVLNIIRDYPDRRSAYKALHEQKVTADISGTPGGGAANRKTEGVALRQLSHQEQREYEAVHNAIKRMSRMKDAKMRQEVIKLTMWKGYSIAGAALILPVAESTARRWRWQFIMLVGMSYGFLTEEEYLDAIKKDMGK